MPPYWLHQTATISRAAAVNLWSPSDEARRAEEGLLLLSDLHPAIAAAASKRAALCVCARAARAVAAHVAAVAAAEAAAEADATADADADADAAGESAAADASAGAGAAGAPAAADLLLRRIYAAQHAHLSRRGARAKRDAAAAVAAVVAPPPGEVCAAEAAGVAGPAGAEAGDGGVEETARRLAAAIGALPSGVRELTLADMITELAEYVASSAGKGVAWPGDKGRRRAVTCLVLDMAPDTCR